MTEDGNECIANNKNKNCNDAFEVEERMDDSTLPEPDYDFLGSSRNATQEQTCKTSNGFENKGKTQSSTNSMGNSAMSQYTLGTLIVRVVAARNLKDMKKGGIGHFLWGRNNHQNNNRSRRHGHGHGGLESGSTNPHATLCFGDQLQRTSQAYETLNPIFPRSEQSYFDVTIPVHSVVLDQKMTSKSKKSARRKYSSDTARKNASRAGIGKANRTNQYNANDLHSVLTYLPPPLPLLTINMFHLDTDSNGHAKNHARDTNLKDGLHHNPHDHRHLGGATINVSSVITGKVPYIDSWIPLHTNEKQKNQKNSKQHFSSSSSVTATPIPYNGEVRIICEYEPIDPPPRSGDMCRLTGFCNPTHYLYPLTNPSRMFLVNEVNGNDVILSYKSTPENWNCQFRVHRNMIVCAVRHQAAMEKYKEQILNVTDKFIQSPIYDTITDVVKRRLPDDGLLQVGTDGLKESINLLGRWMGGGLGTMVGDIIYATNMNGQHSKSILDRETTRIVSNDIIVEDLRVHNEKHPQSLNIPKTNESIEKLKIDSIPGKQIVATKLQRVGNSTLGTATYPNDFKCPVSLEIMKDPYVLVQSGHTYEKKAIYMALAHRPNVDPKTNQSFHGEPQLIPNHTLRGLIHSWLDEHQD